MPTRRLKIREDDGVTFDSWGGNIAEIGAIYPSGAEAALVVLVFVGWIAWFVVQGRMENREYRDEMSQLSEE